MNSSRTRRVILGGLATAAAMILSYVETFVPSVAPGIKLGLPNIAVLFVLYAAGPLAALAVSLVRVVLSSLLFGSVLSMAYALAGALCSLGVMTLLRHTRRFSPVGVSVAGGAFHNLAQVSVAAVVMRTSGVAFYLPLLLAGGTAAGIVIGIAGGILISRLGGLWK